MFGADTPLVIDAIQIAGLALVAGSAAVWFFMRRRDHGAVPPKTAGTGPLEDRVRVLERIATDRSADLAEEIDALRTEKEAN